MRQSEVSSQPHKSVVRLPCCFWCRWGSVDRRRLMAVQLLALVAALAVVGCARSTSMLLAGMLGVGLLGTAMTQGLIAYAASAAAPHEQGRVVGRPRVACSSAC